MLQSTSVANASLAAVLSDWFCNFWNMVTGEYDLVLRSEVDYSDEDIDFMEYAGLSDKDIEDITSTQIVIPENSDEAKQIDYELTYYVNDINTANTQVLMTYGRNDTEKDVYTYGLDRIVHDDLQSNIASDYVYDGRGSVVQTVSEGEIDLSITYDPYGDITGGVDENFVGYAYNGEESNEVTGLQYLRARYYNTEIGSFISIDTYLGSITEPISQNRYTYANNNPVNNIDPTGHYSQGVNKYYQSTGLNELRDQMVAASFHAGEVEAQNAFNRQVARAQNTSMFNYNSINGISQDTANAYIANDIIKAAETSMNYGCETPTLSAEAVATYVVTVQNAKTTANQKISNIKRNKQVQYRAYMEYQRELQRQREAAAAEQERIRRNLQKMLQGMLPKLQGMLDYLNGMLGNGNSNYTGSYNTTIPDGMKSVDVSWAYEDKELYLKLLTNTMNSIDDYFSHNRDIYNRRDPMIEALQNVINAINNGSSSAYIPEDVDIQIALNYDYNTSGDQAIIELADFTLLGELILFANNFSEENIDGFSVLKDLIGTIITEDLTIEKLFESEKTQNFLKVITRSITLYNLYNIYTNYNNPENLETQLGISIGVDDSGAYTYTAIADDNDSFSSISSGFTIALNLKEIDKQIVLV